MNEIGSLVLGLRYPSESVGEGLGGIAADRLNNVYVTGRDSENAFKITPDGIITEIIDSSGDGIGNILDYPTAVAADGVGNVYVLARVSDNIFKIGPDGQITEIIDSNGDDLGNILGDVNCMALDSVPNVYATGEWSDNAFRVTPGGVITQIIDATGDGAGKVLLEVDVFDPFGNRRTEQQLALALAAGPFTPVLLATTGDHHRARAIGNQPSQPYLAVDVVQTQLHQFRAPLDQMAVLGDHVSVAATGNADADHGIRRTVLRCCGKKGPLRRIIVTDGSPEIKPPHDGPWAGFPIRLFGRIDNPSYQTRGVALPLNGSVASRPLEQLVQLLPREHQLRGPAMRTVGGDREAV